MTRPKGRIINIANTGSLTYNPKQIEPKNSKSSISNLRCSSYRGEVTELVPVPAFKAVVAVREHGEVSSILMLSRQFSLKNQKGTL